MPLYEYYCDNCDNVFEALRSIAQSDQPAKCLECGAAADRIMPTTFSSMVRKQGWKQRAPFHQSGVRAESDGKKTIARVKPKGAAKPAAKAARPSIPQDDRKVRKG
jgi:putative FmdB family regulatory protein